ncbi:hypothetical protein U1Q18_023009 [Sarracenia purpurea var. burkii]
MKVINLKSRITESQRKDDEVRSRSRSAVVYSKNLRRVEGTPIRRFVPTTKKKNRLKRNHDGGSNGYRHSSLAIWENPNTMEVTLSLLLLLRKICG